MAWLSHFQTRRFSMPTFWHWSIHNGYYWYRFIILLYSFRFQSWLRVYWLFIWWTYFFFLFWVFIGKSATLRKSTHQNVDWIKFAEINVFACFVFYLLFFSLWAFQCVLCVCVCVTEQIVLMWSLYGSPFFVKRSMNANENNERTSINAADFFIFKLNGQQNKGIIWEVMPMLLVLASIAPKDQQQEYTFKRKKSSIVKKNTQIHIRCIHFHRCIIDRVH